MHSRKLTMEKKDAEDSFQAMLELLNKTNALHDAPRGDETQRFILEVRVLATRFSQKKEVKFFVNLLLY